VEATLFKPFGPGEFTAAVPAVLEDAAPELWGGPRLNPLGIVASLPRFGTAFG
jgi:hypothetical protein